MSSRICARRRRPSTAISAWSSWASCLFPLFRAPSWVSEARGEEEGDYGRPGDEPDQCYCSSSEVQSDIPSLSGPRSALSGSGGWTVRPKVTNESVAGSAVSGGDSTIPLALQKNQKKNSFSSGAIFDASGGPRCPSRSLLVNGFHKRTFLIRDKGSGG